MKRVDWLLILGVVAGAFVGAISLSYYAMQRFHLYLLSASSGAPYFDFPGNVPVRSRQYDLEEMALWAFVGILVGAFLGALGVSVLRAVNRH